MNLKAKAMLATAVFSIGLFVNASPIWAEPQPLTIPSNGIVLQGKAKEKYAADYMKTYFRNMKPPENVFPQSEAACSLRSAGRMEDGNRYG